MEPEQHRILPLWSVKEQIPRLWIESRVSLQTPNSQQASTPLVEPLCRNYLPAHQPPYRCRSFTPLVSLLTPAHSLQKRWMRTALRSKRWAPCPP